MSNNEKWQAVLKDFEASGLSQAEYSRRAGIDEKRQVTKELVVEKSSRTKKFQDMHKTKRL